MDVDAHIRDINGIINSLTERDRQKQQAILAYMDIVKKLLDYIPEKVRTEVDSTVQMLETKLTGIQTQLEQLYTISGETGIDYAGIAKISQDSDAINIFDKITDFTKAPLQAEAAAVQAANQAAAPANVAVGGTKKRRKRKRSRRRSKI
jgi:hypothetical protein